MNAISEILRRPPIGWWDVLDILVVSIVIYELLKLIRGTRAVQMAIGGGVFVLLFYTSRWSRLETVNWLVRNLGGYLAFAVIVLFNPISASAAHIGRAPFFRYSPRRNQKRHTMKIVVAAGALGDKTARSS
jgi:diadenylate cyclase